MLLGEGADHRGWAPVVRARQGRLRSRKRVPAEVPAALVELLRVARHRQRRARVATAARRFERVGAGLPGDAERPFELAIVGLELGVGDRPVGERGAGQVAGHGAQAEVVLGESRQPALPMDRAAAHHLRHRAEQLDARRLVGGGAHGARIEQRVGPEIVAVDIGELVAAEGLARPPRAALQRHHLDATLGQDLGRGRTRSAGTDDADLGPLGACA